MARNKRREPRRQPPREQEMIVFAAAGEPRFERKFRCNRSKLRIRTSLRRLAPADTDG